MTLDELIRRAKEQLNARIAAHNTHTEALNKLRGEDGFDVVKESEIVAQRAAVDAEAETLRKRVAELEAEKLNDDAIQRLQSDVTPLAPVSPTARGQVTERENPVYRKGDTEVSYFRDLFQSRHMGDQAAQQRMIASQETRAASSTAGSGGEMAPPLWLINDFVELARAARVTADQVPTETLPGGVSSINLPKITAGSTVGVTQTQNTTITEGTVTTTSVSSGIAEITGKQTISIALLRQSGVSLDSIIIGDLAAAYATKLDVQVLSGANANGELRGLITAGTTITYTSAAPAVVSVTAANSFYLKILGAQVGVSGTRFLPADKIIMHPRRWAWVLSALDSSNRPLVTPNGAAFNQAAVTGAQVAEGFAGEMLGLPVYVDPNIPTNIGVATNQDYVFVLLNLGIAGWQRVNSTRGLVGLIYRAPEQPARIPLSQFPVPLPALVQPFLGHNFARGGRSRLSGHVRNLGRRGTHHVLQEP